MTPKLPDPHRDPEKKWIALDLFKRWICESQTQLLVENEQDDGCPVSRTKDSGNPAGMNAGSAMDLPAGKAINQKTAAFNPKYGGRDQQQWGQMRFTS